MACHGADERLQVVRGQRLASARARGACNAAAARQAGAHGAPLMEPPSPAVAEHALHGERVQRAQPVRQRLGGGHLVV
jgi:hypothetical protein